MITKFTNKKKEIRVSEKINGIKSSLRGLGKCKYNLWYLVFSVGQNNGHNISKLSSFVLYLIPDLIAISPFIYFESQSSIIWLALAM